MQYGITEKKIEETGSKDGTLLGDLDKEGVLQFISKHIPSRKDELRSRLRTSHEEITILARIVIETDLKLSKKRVDKIWARIKKQQKFQQPFQKLFLPISKCMSFFLQVKDH